MKYFSHNGAILTEVKPDDSLENNNFFKDLQNRQIKLCLDMNKGTLTILNAKATYSYYYMRDNHTFIKLSTELNLIEDRLRREFEEDNTYGSFFIKDGDRNIGSVHAQDDIIIFLKKVKALFKEINK